MKPGTAFAATVLALVSFPLLAQQPSPGTQPASPATQQNPPGTAPAPQDSQATSPETAAVMSSVNGELETKLDSKTAKAGDSVVVQTKASVKTSDGTEIPKGSKLMGHVIGVQASEEGKNSQVALQFDHVEMKGGQNLAVHSQIQSIAPPEGAASTTASTPTDGAMNRPQANPGTGGANGRPAAGAPQGAASETATAAGSDSPAAGTVVAKNGNIAIVTTSIPGVLLANNAPGLQDPRMARASSILLGARKDIQLDGGTQMVVGLSAAGGGAQ
jgi:hypothetical protein